MNMIIIYYSDKKVTKRLHFLQADMITIIFMGSICFETSCIYLSPRLKCYLSVTVFIMYIFMLLDEGVCLMTVVVVGFFFFFSFLLCLFGFWVALLLSDSSPSTKISPEIVFPLQGECQKSPKTQRCVGKALTHIHIPFDLSKISRFFSHSNFLHVIGLTHFMNRKSITSCESNKQYAKRSLK